MQEESRRLVPRECVADVLSGPRCGRMTCNGHVHDAPAIVRQQDQYEQQAAARRRDHEEIRRHDLAHVIAQERMPCLRRRLTSTDHVLGNARLPDLNTELQQFAVDARCAPERIGGRDRANQRADLRRQRRPPHATPALPLPEDAEPSTVPGNDGLGFDDHERRWPFMPHARDPHPEQAVRARQAQPSRGERWSTWIW